LPSGRATDDGWDDGWREGDDAPPPLRTEVIADASRSIITRNQSPDVSFDRSINPYRGCEHGCIYCFARPSHAWLGMSPGADFESRLFAKPNAAALLAKELSAPGYVPNTIALGTNTDAYQPIEKKLRITRSILQVLLDFKHPVGIVTKSPLVLRDADILGEMADMGLARVALSVTTLDRKLARAMEPRAGTPARRLEAIKALSGAGIPTHVMFAPVIPALNDGEMESVLAAAKDAGAAAPAAGDQGPVPRMAGSEPAGQRAACDVADPPDARRQGLRRPVAHPHARHRALCRIDRAALPHGGQAAGPEHGRQAAAYQPVQAPAPRGRPAGVILEGPCIQTRACPHHRGSHGGHRDGR
jgi:DNA repair photolyase